MVNRERQQSPGSTIHDSPSTTHHPPPTIHHSPFTIDHLRLLGWLLPATYAAHVWEEWRYGFPAWWSALTGVRLETGRFLALNGWALAAMIVGVALGYASRRMRWLFVSFGVTVFVNGCGHLSASAATRSYSPGAVTGALLWLPLGTALCVAGRRALKRRTFAASVAVGLLMHACVVLLAFFG